VPALMQALRDDDLWVRRFAASALGSIGPAARLAIPRLRDLAESGDPAQIEAAMALRAIGRPAG
jgi:HEAT repeat protein